MREKILQQYAALTFPVLPLLLPTPAGNRVPEIAEIELPPNYDDQRLNLLASIADRDYVPFKVSQRQGEELAHIGRQLLVLDDKNYIYPPFDGLEKQLIQQLLSIVNTSEQSLSKSEW